MARRTICQCRCGKTVSYTTSLNHVNFKARLVDQAAQFQALKRTGLPYKPPAQKSKHDQKRRCSIRPQKRPHSPGSPGAESRLPIASTSTLPISTCTPAPVSPIAPSQQPAIDPDGLLDPEPMDMDWDHTVADPTCTNHNKCSFIQDNQAECDAAIAAASRQAASGAFQILASSGDDAFADTDSTNSDGNSSSIEDSNSGDCNTDEEDFLDCIAHEAPESDEDDLEDKALTGLSAYACLGGKFEAEMNKLGMPHAVCGVLPLTDYFT